MSQILPRFNAALERQQDERKLARILLETGPTELPTTVSKATLAGDPRRLRGIPVVGRGVPGVSPGTNPIGVIRD